MSDEQKERLAATIAGGLSQAERSVQERMLRYLSVADPDYAERVGKALGTVTGALGTCSRVILPIVAKSQNNKLHVESLPRRVRRST